MVSNMVSHNTFYEPKTFDSCGFIVSCDRRYKYPTQKKQRENRCSSSMDNDSSFIFVLAVFRATFALWICICTVVTDNNSRECFRVCCKMVVFYNPQSGDRVGYDVFPAVPRKIEITLRREGLKEGFRY